MLQHCQINPPCGANGDPTRYPDEDFIIELKEIVFEVTLSTKQVYKGQNRVFLTTERLVLINNHGDFKGFEIPLGYIT